MRLLLIAVAASFLLAGCGGDYSTAPKVRQAPTTSLVVVRTEVLPNGVRVLYTKEGTYVCSYPNNFIGPLPQGYCTLDGSMCGTW